MKKYEIGDTIELFNGDYSKLTAKIIGTSSIRNTAYLVSDFSHLDFYPRLRYSRYKLESYLIDQWLEQKWDDEYIGNIADYFNKLVVWVILYQDGTYAPL